AYLRGAESIDKLRPGARVLIAESCSHTPAHASEASVGAVSTAVNDRQTEGVSEVPPDADIGRVKIPHMLSDYIGGDIFTEVAAGKDFPEDLSGYDLILQCGGCMVNRRQIMNRIQLAEEQGVPITNYGIAIAFLKGILGRITI
ncbi:MAG: hypothetical protein IK096_04455, partial [Lachnospiraceae bacterium]|nr:hypothetical protein [Lachnospiraceae bacterium]